MYTMFHRAIMAAGMLGAIWIIPAQAQFYDKKTLTIVVNYGVGGNADLSARIFQKNLRRHIAGAPTIVVQNMPGAGGALAMNSLGLEIGFKADGYTAGFFGLNPPALIAGDPGLRVSLNHFEMVGAVRDWNVAYVRKDAVPGIQRPEEIIKARELFAGGYSKSNANDTRSSLALEVLGIKYRMITGFPGTADLNKAMLQNEVNFANSALPGYVRQAVPQIMNTGIGMPLFYFPTTGPDGKIGKVDSLERMGIIGFAEVYERIHGAPPGGVKFDALLLMCDLDSAMHGVIALPKGAPSEAVAELRRAFNQLREDPEFREEYEKTTGEKPEIVLHDEMTPLLKRFAQTPENIKKVFQDLIAQ